MTVHEWQKGVFTFFCLHFVLLKPLFELGRYYLTECVAVSLTSAFVIVFIIHAISF